MPSPVTPDAPPPPVDVAALSFQAKLKMLRDMAAHPVRRPTLTLQCATDILARHSSKLSDTECCSLHEQALIAALECGRVEVAGDHHRFLAKKFGRASVRVRKLQGLLLEGQGNTEGAIALYKQLLVDAPGEPFIAKRFAAILRAEGSYQKAIDTLEKAKVYPDPKEKGTSYTFMQLHSSDENACRELCALHWLTWDLNRAVFYAEELLLCDPHNFMHHCRLAELLYANGDLPRSATSFAQSLRLNDAPNNTRAMYGLWLVATQLVTKAKKTDKVSKEDKAIVTSVAGENAAALVELAEARLRAAYQGSAMLSCLDLMLQAYSVGPQ